MEQPYPKKLEKDPIIECLFEMRFRTASGIAASEILPGIIFNQFGSKYPRTSSLPASQIPKDIRLHDPNFKYTPTFKMENDQFAIMLGENVVSLSCQRPYVGWDKFKPQILSLCQAILKSGIINHIERLSLKYINLIENIENSHGLNLLDSKISIGAFDLNEIGCNLRIEIKNQEIIKIVAIASSAQVNIQKTQTQLTGLLFDIDSIFIIEGGWNASQFESLFDQKLDEVRENEKNIFFSMLLQNTVDHYGPIYEGGDIQ